MQTQNDIRILNVKKKKKKEKKLDRKKWMDERVGTK